MSPKERVLTTFAFGKPDRVPIDYYANPGIDGRLKAHYGLAPDDHEGLMRALGVDFRYIGAPYVGPQLHEDAEEEGVQVDIWGIHRRWVEHETGGYWDYCDFPLQGATLEEVEAWPMPSPDDFDYDRVPELCRQYGDYAVVAGNAGLGDIINSAGMVFHMERVLIGLITDDPALLRYIDRRLDVLHEVTRRTLEAAGGGIDVLQMGEDLGTQIGPMISLKLYRKHLRPRHQRFVDLGKAFDIPVMIHTCGSSSWAYEDFIEMGIKVVDTLQPEAKHMSPTYLKRTFGGRLAFHGCISTAGPVAYGTPEEVVRDVRETLAVMMPPPDGAPGAESGGYALSPTHQLQDNSPTENVVAMYDAARTYGWY
jgi:uroporphyrinogen decarboxylase